MKKQLHSIHLYSSIFFLPLAFLYAFTGILFLVGYYGEVKTQTYEPKEEFSSPLSQEELKDYLLEYLATNNIKIPYDTKTKPTRDKQGIQMGVMSYIAQIKQNNNKLIIQTSQRDFINNLLMLHFAKGRWYFDVLGIAFGLALAIFYFTGIMMIHRSKHKKALWFVFFVGLFITVTTALLSSR